MISMPKVQSIRRRRMNGESIASIARSENVSEPMSKGDRYITYPVRVTASNLVKGEATMTYNKLTVRVVGQAPKGVERVQVFDLPGNDPAESGSMN